jgi:hypothetical protein
MIERRRDDCNETFSYSIIQLFNFCPIFAPHENQLDVK